MKFDQVIELLMYFVKFLPSLQKEIQTNLSSPSFQKKFLAPNDFTLKKPPD